MRVKLGDMPDPKKQGTITLQNLFGGLNLHEDPTHVSASQSPDMLNMWYRDGMLKKRAGQTKVFNPVAGGTGTVWFYDKLFHGLVVYAAGTSICYFNPSATSSGVKKVSGITLPSSTGHGTFFAFDEHLYYKAWGIYVRLSYSNGTLTGERILWQNGSGYSIAEDVYTPVIIINRNPDGTGGDLYQPENRINPKKTVWFDVDNSSYDYYLPVHGCRVTQVQVEDTVVDTSDTSTRTFAIGGRNVQIIDENIPDSSTKFTRLKFDVPLHVDETGWTAKGWIGTTSQGSNFLPNIKYSNFNIPATANTTFKNGVMLRRGDSASPPSEYTSSFLGLALSKCPYSDKSKRFAFDNGTWFNLFILSPTFKVVKYQSSNTEMWMTNYFRVSYHYPTNKWTTYDMMGRTNEGWHYAQNCIYSTVDVYYGSTKIISTQTTPTDGSTILESYSSLAEAHGGLTNVDHELIWISANTDLIVFHYLVGDNQFYVTHYDATNGFFKCKAIRQVTIHRNNPRQVDYKDILVPGTYGHLVKNIVWASRDLVYNSYVPGDVIKGASGTLTSRYQKLAEIALYRARRDFPNANITGNYAIAENGKYVTIYIDAGMELKYYDLKTGEFKASNWIQEGFVMNEEYEDITLNITTPAALSNKLRVTYTKDNPDAMKAIADCRFATSFGGSDAVCVVLGRCDKQPNAIFWSGNGSYGVDATYFPMDQYNLCGAYQDPVTGFGKQQNVLVVFQSHHVAKATYRIEETNGRKFIDLPLSTINTERGCDMPWSIALCGNNLVWMHSKHGVMFLRDATAAYENMIVVISENVNGNAARPGLLQDLRTCGEYEAVGAEDGQRYYAFVKDKLWVWDYTISSVSDGISSLSWSRHSPFSAEAVVEADTGTVWFANSSGQISKINEDATTDFGATIPCHYRTPTQTFGGYGRVRTVNRAVLSILNNPDGPIAVEYGGEGQGRWRDGYSYLDRITSEITTLSGDTIVSKAGKSIVIKTAGRYNPDVPESGEFWMPLVLKPRGVRVNNFWLEISAEGGLAINQINIAYTTHSLTK
jgi:hypothetical protein